MLFGTLSHSPNLFHPSTILLTFSGVSVVVLLGIQLGSLYKISGRLKNSSDGKTPKQTVVHSLKRVKTTLNLITSAIQLWRPAKPTVSPECSVGLLVTAELENVLATCKAKVERISRECRAGNRKFRDIEFDLEKDQFRCVFGLDVTSNLSEPADVRRVTEIYDEPTFFLGGPDADDIKQGRLGDCWLMAALSMISTSKGLAEKFCVARDESVGVYGFVFFFNESWVDVIIDDQLLWGLPKFEFLTAQQQALYNDDRSEYNMVARKGAKGLHFAESGTQGQTWVPLVEKAYAKLYGDYEAMSGGYSTEAIENFTGGVPFMYATKDILDIDRFWNEELVHAGKGSLFGCFFDPSSSGLPTRDVQGLVSSHLYAILRVTEYKGKRFIVLRNPWGTYEWTGPWSDGSVEWTDEWIDLRKELDHKFGDDGEFVMEYSDFLKTWHYIEKTTIFDSSWMMSSHWLRMPPQPLLYPWTFGEVTFNVTLNSPSPVIIVLSKLDGRSFSRIDGISYWNLDFVVCKRGELDYITASGANARFYQRNVACELELEAGEYVVYPRVDRYHLHNRGYFEEGLQDWDERKLSKVLIKRAKARSIASNFNQSLYKKLNPTSLSSAIDKDMKDAATMKPIVEERDIVPDPTFTTTNQSQNTDTSKKRCQDWNGTGEDEDEDALYLGLRVYTKNNVIVTINGRLKSDT